MPAATNVEKGEELSRQLNTRQIGMIGIGGAIGTGLFLGSSLAVHTAGPAVIVSYLMGAVIALLLMGALAEMAVAHPTAGSFGIYAELYVSRWAGFTIRYTYWAAQMIQIGGEAVAISIYCQWWFPGTPKWIWIVGFSLALLYVNLRSVGSFGTFEYWFSMIKVSAIVLFIVLGFALVFGLTPRPAVGFANLTAHGGFLPNGFSGAWMALAFVIFSYLGSEIVAVTSGEAANPEVVVPRALRYMVGRMILFYLGAVFLLVTIVPWTQIQPGADVTASPFVTVFRLIGIPAAAHVVNFVVITAAASSINCNLYLVSRMMFSLARGGYAPQAFGRVSANGVPVPALLASAVGLAAAVILATFFPDSAFVYMFGIALFGGLYAWGLIFVTHLFFRRRWETEGGRRLPVRMIGYPWTSILGAASLLAILITTWWVEGMRVTLISGVPWLMFLTAAYWMIERRTGAKGR